MAWKTDENGILAVENGNPVWLYEGEKEGQEAAVDFSATLKTIAKLTGESIERKNKIKELKDRLAPLEEAGIEDLPDWLSKSKAALETVANLDDKKLIDAGEVEKVKASLKEAHQKELAKLNASLDEKEHSIRELIIRSAFDQSDFLREKTVLLPDMAYSYFGSRFDIAVEDGKPVGFANDSNGSRLMSVKNPGKYADPVEAIEILVNEHPQKERMLKMEASGSGTPPSGTPSAGGGDLTAQYKKAKEAGDTAAMISLKREMTAAGVAAPL